MHDQNHTRYGLYKPRLTLWLSGVDALAMATVRIVVPREMFVDTDNLPRSAYRVFDLTRPEPRQ